jgi:hypothetical protein
MLKNESVVAVFGDVQGVDVAVKKLARAGMRIEHLSVIGKGSHSEERLVGFYDVGDRTTFWGKRGAFWGDLWSLFDGGVSLTIPVLGHVMILGYLAPIVASAVDGAIMAGGLSPLGAALYSAGAPRESIVQYEQAVKADGFLVIVHGAVEELARARGLLLQDNPSRLDLHDGSTTSFSGLLPAVAVTDSTIDRSPSDRLFGARIQT